MFEDLFQYKRVNLEKLEPFGFIKNEDIYRYEIDEYSKVAEPSNPTK